MYTALLLSVLCAASDPGAARVVDQALRAVGGRTALEKQESAAVHSRLVGTSHEEQVLRFDFETGAVRIENRIGRRAVRVRGQNGKIAWEYKKGAIALGTLSLHKTIWFPHHLLMKDGVEIERVRGAPEGQTRLLLTYDDELQYVDVDAKGALVRYEGFTRVKGKLTTVVVDYLEWTKQEGQVVPARLKVTVAKDSQEHELRVANFNRHLLRALQRAAARANGADL